MKKGVIISFILIIFLFSIVSAAFTIDDSGDLQERDSQEAEGETYPTYEPEDVVEEVEGATYDDEGYNFEEVTDEEFEMEQKLIMLENEDKKQDAQRNMAWFALSGMLLYPAFVIIATLFGLDKAAKILGDMAAVYFVSVAAIVAAFYGKEALAKKK